MTGSGGSSRRTFLGRLTLAAAAMSVAPLRYLLRPQSAWATISPGHCGGGLCDDGYTEFCCSIHRGRNTCPGGTFVGGWWKCSHYGGAQLCSDTGVRYYVDCNLKPGHGWPGGCHCAHGDCGQRRVACNVFRYGQCNTHVGPVTPIVCRVIVCENPATVPAFNCNSSYKQDNNTCGHEAGCLNQSNVHVMPPNPGARVAS